MHTKVSLDPDGRGPPYVADPTRSRCGVHGASVRGRMHRRGINAGDLPVANHVLEKTVEVPQVQTVVTIARR